MQDSDRAPRQQCTNPNMSEFYEKLAKALVQVVKNTRGRRATVRAKQLLRVAKISPDQSNIVRAAMFLKKLSLKKLIFPEIRKRFTRSASLNYVVLEGSELWCAAKEDPERALRMIMMIVRE